MEINVPSLVRYHRETINALSAVVRRLQSVVFDDNDVRELLLAQSMLDIVEVIVTNESLVNHLTGNSELQLEMGRVVYRPPASSPL